MINCNFSKIIATMGPSIAKETALARIMNHVDIFLLNLSYWIEENNKKNIEAIKKLDNSKVLILDTQWIEISSQNIELQTIKKWQDIEIKFSPVKKEKDNKIHVNYPKIMEIPVWTNISINDQKKVLCVKRAENDTLYCKVLANAEIRTNSTIVFEKFDFNDIFYTELRKKELLWWVRNWINIFAVSVVNWQEMDSLRKFLLATGKDVRLIAKIDSLVSLKNIDEIIQKSDWIIIDRIKLENHMSLEKINSEKEKIVKSCHSFSKPVMVSWRVLESMINKTTFSKKEIDTIASDVISWVDWIILVEETIISDNPYELIVQVNKVICDNQKHVDIAPIHADIQKRLKKWECSLEDYIIYTAFDIAEKLNAKIILCTSERWYTPTKLSSLKPDIPIVAFVKNDDMYRYINLHRAVRWYKIASEFNWENIKRIWKEIVRITFKGDITLEDKILIVHAWNTNSNLNQNQVNNRNMLNGIEIYRFKDL